MRNLNLEYNQTSEGDILVHCTGKKKNFFKKNELHSVAYFFFFLATLKPLLDSIYYDIKFLVKVDGSIDVSCSFDLDVGEVFPALPRVGLQCRLPNAFNYFTWEGRGPHEKFFFFFSSSFFSINKYL